MADTLGVLNPLRYRGYVYDTETQLYYLQSRYYDPELGRFINADAFTSTGQGLLGNNMFAYCGNNPVNRLDPTGDFWFLIPIVLIPVVLGACSSADDFETYQKDIIGAPDLDVEAEDIDTYNCFGNALLKNVNLDPYGVTIGDSCEEVYLAVEKTVGAKNIRPLASINAPISNDEYRVALKCGPAGYHFIRQDDIGWYNKAGAEYLGVYVTPQYVESEVWGSAYMFDGVIHYECTASYVGETFYFAIRKGWDK